MARRDSDKDVATINAIHYVIKLNLKMKKLKKLALKKDVLSELSKEAQGGLRGGGTRKCSDNCPTNLTCPDPTTFKS
ncbi:hypothetical protein [Aureibacter tunicatorum]|nr:hypothetical protein [Aureibacter tunicatorum]BDD04583.1 hypothetical protein AUTU_20660 [Aureibacter tunicatorum]